MSDCFNIIDDLQRHLGQTVTIFTASGGQSGLGFTGVLVTVNENFVRLITQIGPAPGCALGSCCNSYGNKGYYKDGGFEENEKHEENNYSEYGGKKGRKKCHGSEGNEDVANVAISSGDEEGVGVGQVASCCPNTLGSIVDLPTNKIVAFVHNAVGSDW